MALSAADLIASLKKRFPDREYFALVADLKGETWFLTRFVCEINVPEEIKHENLTRDQMYHRLARFVSLIPYEPDSINYANTCDLWGTNVDFLSCVLGDEEEHAVLLLSYFIAMEAIEPKILFGYSINHGSSCWIVSVENDKVCLWNPLTGLSYFSTDPKCPLTAIYCAADAENIYYNVQSDVRPSRINWNFDSWQKLWSNTKDLDLPTLQVRQFHYDPVDQNLALRDASNMERFVKERIRSWRLGKLTRFRSDIAQVMKQILIQCEILAMENSPIQSILMDTIIQKFPNSKVIGYPLHLNSNDQSAMEEKVKSVGIHKSNRSNVEFAITAHVQPYPGNIQSIWLYLAQITPT